MGRCLQLLRLASSSDVISKFRGIKLQNGKKGDTRAGDDFKCAANNYVGDSTQYGYLRKIRS